jgi:hypothetical protein
MLALAYVCRMGPWSRGVLFSLLDRRPYLLSPLAVWSRYLELVLREPFPSHSSLIPMSSNLSHQCLSPSTPFVSLPGFQSC